MRPDKASQRGTPFQKSELNLPGKETQSGQEQGIADRGILLYEGLEDGRDRMTAGMRDSTGQENTWC